MLLVGSTGGFWFRTTYWVDAEGVGWQRLGGRRARRWPQLRRAEEFGGEAGGVMLSPYLRPTSLDRVRSVELRWAGNREVVLAAVREGMGERRDPG